MNLELVRKIANAVLYEGYLLYPYRHSSVKNQRRFNFGVLAPQAYSLAQGGAEAWSMQTECLVRGSRQAALDVKVRFLHLLAREELLEAGGQVFQTWQEGVEREINAPGLNLNELAAEPQRLPFSFPAKQEREPLSDAWGEVAGEIVRTQQAIAGAVEIGTEALGERLSKVTVRLLNLTLRENAAGQSRDEALLWSLVSAHTILGVRDGEFVSLLDPPEEFKAAAATCKNVGTYPVLAGEEGERDLMLSSPIILYDYPQIAPESAGDLFDGAEIDEILTLRIMTLTDEEKREMRNGDERARQILERTESLPPEQLMKMHGAMRALHPLAEEPS